MSRYLRTAHVTATFPPYRGGTGNLVWNETRALARRGHDVHVFTPGVGDGSAPDGVHVHYMRPLLRVGNASIAPGSLGRLLRGFDLLHLYYPFFSSELVWAAARLSHAPMVVTYVHDVEIQGFAGFLAEAYRVLVGRRVLCAADHVLFLSLDYAQSSRVADLAGRRNVSSHSPGVDTERFRPSVRGESVRRAHGISPKDVLLLFVGGLDRAHYFKGVGTLLHALQRLARPDLRLLIVGDGDLRFSYEQQVCQLGLAGRVMFAGNVADEFLASHYAAADVLVFPSTTRSEAFGLVLLEAMACGTPVIASRLPGVRSVVLDTGGGVLVTPGDPADLATAIAGLADHPERRSVLGVQGRRSVEATFTWDAVGRRLEEIYFEVLGQVRSINARAVGM